MERKEMDVKQTDSYEKTKPKTAYEALEQVLDSQEKKKSKAKDGITMESTISQ